MEFTRVDTKALAAAVAEATEHIRLALLLMDPFLVTITDEEREDYPRPSVRYPDAGRSLARGAVDAPDMAARAEFVPAAVTEDLDNAAALAPLLERLAVLVQRTDDSKLVWLAEAYVPSLALYRLAKAGAKVNGNMAALV
jgi:hypothetical protein